MFRSVVARDASKPEITDNHSYGLCQFGRWIDHLGPLDNDELPYVRLMDSAHQHMHNCGRELMLAIVENHWQDAHFDAFQEGLLSFTAALTDYKIYLLTIRSNMDVLTGLPGRRVLDESFDHQLRAITKRFIATGAKNLSLLSKRLMMKKHVVQVSEFAS